MRLLIAVPVFNERRYVGQVLDKIRMYGDEILVVNDGSTDGTSEVLCRRKDIRVVRHPVNRGYGQSIINSFQYADAHGYDWVITMDCDEQHEPESIPDFIEAIRTDQWDLISGSRYLRPTCADNLPPDDRRSINTTITEIINSLFALNLTDSFCGFKAHRVSAMRRVQLDSAATHSRCSSGRASCRRGFASRKSPCG